MGQQVQELFGWARRRKFLATFFVGLTLAVGILIGSVVSGRVSAMRASFAGTNAAPLSVPDPIPSASSFSGIVNRVEPAVVNIATTQVLERKSSAQRKRRTPSQGQGQGDGDDPMQDFFDRFFDGRQDAPPQAERSLGSGVIVD
jgi:S1-C subfamily serine protease